MASKYASLPDIDTASADVYETPDVPASFAFGHDSDSDNDEHGLNTSGSSSNLLNAARLSSHAAGLANGAADSDEAISRARLRPSEARDLFSKRHMEAGTSLLPESATYSVRNATRHAALSSTSKRQQRHAKALQRDDSLFVEEPETPTEKLRRLRYEAQELEEQLETEAAAAAKQAGPSTQANGNGAMDKQSEEEDVVHDLPLRDDADKTRPPPSRRRTKKAQVDENGELSPAILMQQLKKLRGGLAGVNVNGHSAEAADNEAGHKDAQSQELLQRLSEMRLQAVPTASTSTQHDSTMQSGSANPTTSSLTAVDSRLEALEKFVGTHEADVDEAKPLPTPLLSTLAKLEHQLQLLTQPRHLDTISRRVKTLVTDLERVHEARRKTGDTRPLNVALSSGITVSTGPPGLLSPTLAGPGTGANEQQLPPDTLQKVDGLFNLLPRIEPLVPLAPHLLNRLRSLQTLHDSASTFAKNLEDGEKAVEGLKQSETFLTQLLEGLQESLAANQEVMKSNLEGLQGRVDSVMQRLDKLQQ